MREGEEYLVLSQKIKNAISSVDESLNYRDFAQAVAKVLKDDYGSHLFKDFISTLNSSLSNDINENKLNMDSSITNNFDLKKFITENRLSSKINEEEEKLPKKILIQYTERGDFYKLYLDFADGTHDRVRGRDNANKYIEKLTGKPTKLPLTNYHYNEDRVEQAAQNLRELGIEVKHDDMFDAS